DRRRLTAGCSMARRCRRARNWSASPSRTPTSLSRAGRQVQYAHELNLATGRSGLILDVVIETGNPADAERFLTMLDRHIAPGGARRPGGPAPEGAYPAAPNSSPPRLAASPISPFTRNAASPLPAWSRALGSTAACASSAPASRLQSPASSAPTAPPAAPGVV